MLSSVQSLLFANNREPVSRHIPLALVDPFKRLPPLTQKPVLSQIRNPKSEIRNFRVAIFTGCMVNYVYPEIYEATTRILDKYGISYITPRDQLCCGTPLLLYGDRRNAKRLAQHNLKVFQRQKVDALITMCATCGEMLKEEYPKLQIPNPKSPIPIMDIMEFIHKYIPHYKQRTTNNKLRTNYHQPCHFTWTKAGEITRAILREISDYQETDEEELCCGGGGAFTFQHPKIARQIGQHKIDLFKAADVEVLTTGCPGCIMQLQYLLKESGRSDIRVCHPIELLDEQNNSD